ncbi:helix-turn-helix protein [Solirubrobacter pauli]|uniref:Helix-turn-helix protein n=1 Tax=Solirubrobacter pauli TaxID=166793 RepID=A0A660LHN2_9ACTN|nr:helix-turn-helix transcriptional regulator [Solirubrobacter pauli]RKQ92311.1 helix-turn-helix protein [Solirubrobacter pauli]
MLGDVIRRRCDELGLSQSALADQVGVHVRQIRRYERGEQQPVLGVAAKLAETLGVTLDELAGVGESPLDGDWWSARQVAVDGRALIATVPVTLRRRAPDVLAVEGRGWRGELRVWDEGTLTGWYVGAGPPGTMLFVLDADSTLARGRWVARAVDGSVTGGHAALARTREAASAAVPRPSD